ncbi:MAG: serine hydrolase, partial [Eudoraea sp.]|nr:serine hydrolase [Eudoraea sp.]
PRSFFHSDFSPLLLRQGFVASGLSKAQGASAENPAEIIHEHVVFNYFEQMKEFKLLIKFILIGFCFHSANAQDMSSLESKIDEYIQPYLEMDAWSGVISIYEDGEPIFQKGYGYANREWKTDNTIKTKFRIASISKLFTEVAILKLVEAENIALSNTLSNFIPDYPRGNEITIKQLLNHRAGIPHLNDFPNYDDLIKYDYELNEIIDLF